MGNIPGMRGVENRFFAPKSRKKKRHPGERHHSNGEGGERDLHLGAEAAEQTNILLVVRGVDDRAGAEEKQRLKKGMRQQVKDCGRPRTHPQREHHIAELGDRGKGEDAFDVVLSASNAGAQQGGDCADECDHG